MVVPGCHLELPQALLAAEGSCKLLSEVPGARGVRGPRKVRESLERHTLCTAIPCKYAKSGLCKVLIHTSSAWFHVKKKKCTKPSAAASSSLTHRDNCRSPCFYHLSLKISIFTLLELNGFSPFSHTFPSAGNESRGCSRLSAAVTGCTCSCKACCWETQWSESPLLPSPGPEHVNLCLSSADRHLLLFFQGDQTQRQLLQLSCLWRPPET